MSIEIKTEVVCDHCEMEIVDGASGLTVDAASARRKAKRYGWVRRYCRTARVYEDICPECLADEEDVSHGIEDK